MRDVLTETVALGVEAFAGVSRTFQGLILVLKLC